MSKTIEKRSEIPTYPLYVLSNDTFMSGWGPCGDGMVAHIERRAPRIFKTNTIILPCETLEEAEAVAKYARSRSEQKRVRIVTNKPKVHSGVVYSLMLREEATAWYPPKNEGNANWQKFTEKAKTREEANR